MKSPDLSMAEKKVAEAQDTQLQKKTHAMWIIFSPWKH